MKAYLSSVQVMYKSQFRKKLTPMTGFVVQGHICGGVFFSLKGLILGE